MPYQHQKQFGLRLVPALSTLLVALALSGCDTIGYTDEIQNAYKYAAQLSVKKQLDNPSSATFGDIDAFKDTTDHITLCGTLDYKNTDGSSEKDVFFISDGKTADLSNKMDIGVFRTKWKSLCIKKSPL